MTSSALPQTNTDVPGQVQCPIISTVPCLYCDNVWSCSISICTGIILQWKSDERHWRLQLGISLLSHESNILVSSQYVLKLYYPYIVNFSCLLAQFFLHDNNNFGLHQLKCIYMWMAHVYWINAPQWINNTILWPNKWPKIVSNSNKWSDM